MRLNVIRAKGTVADSWHNCTIILQVALWYAACSATEMENSTSFVYFALTMYRNSHKELSLAI